VLVPVCLCGRYRTVWLSVEDGPVGFGVGMGSVLQKMLMYKGADVSEPR
jgi:hypothetical protein